MPITSCSYDPNHYGTFLETVKIYGLSQPTDVTPTFTTIGISNDITIMGRSFIDVIAIFLSGSPYNSISTIYNPFSSIASLSSNFPAFTAFKVTLSSVNINSDHILTITIPAPSAIGYFDIIIQNNAGYGKLSDFSKKFGNYQPTYYQNGVLVTSADNIFY